MRGSCSNNNLFFSVDDFFIDVAIPSKKIAIEVDGPNHFIAPSREYTMTSQSKHRILTKKGWKVISIPFFVNETSSDAPKIEELLNFE